LLPISISPVSGVTVSVLHLQRQAAGCVSLIDLGVHIDNVMFT